MKTNRLLVQCLAILAFAVSTLLFAQETNAQVRRPPRPTTTITEPGDPNKGEDTITKISFQGVLETVIIQYKSGAKTSRFLRPDGTLSQEVKQNGNLIETVYYKDDGVGRTKAVSITTVVFPQGGWDSNKEEAHYYPDGKTIRYVTVSDRTRQKEMRQYDNAGKLLVKRNWDKDRNMDVVIYDASGKELYSQYWTYSDTSNLLGYELKSMTETTANGAKRRVVMKELGPKENLNSPRTIEKVEYLKADGTVEKTEPGNSLSEPVAPERLQERQDSLAPRTIELR